jgi:hypothetical protein
MYVPIHQITQRHIPGVHNLEHDNPKSDCDFLSVLAKNYVALHVYQI